MSLYIVLFIYFYCFVIVIYITICQFKPMGGTDGALNVDVGTMLASPESKAPIIMLIVNTINVHTTGTWLMNSDDVLYSIKWKRQSRSRFSDRNIIPMNTYRTRSISAAIMSDLVKSM